MSVDPATIAQRVRAVIVEVFQLEQSLPSELSVDTVAKWDSLGHLELIVKLEETFSVQFAHAESVEMLSEADIVAALRAKLS